MNDLSHLLGKKVKNKLTNNIAKIADVNENRYQVHLYSKRFEEKFGAITHKHNTKRTRLSQIGIVIIPYDELLRNWAFVEEK